MITTETKSYLHHSLRNVRTGTPAAVSQMYDEVNALAAEKVALSGRLTKLLERTMARLQHDMRRVVELERDEVGLPPTQDFLAGVENTIRQINGLRAAATQEIGSPALPAMRASPTPAPRAQKSTCVGICCFASTLTFPFLFLRAEGQCVYRQGQGAELCPRSVWT